MAELPKARDFFESSRAAVGDHELRRKLESASARHLDHFAQVKAEFPPVRRRARRGASNQDRRDRASRRIADRADVASSKRADARCSSPRTRRDARDYIVALAKAKGAKNVVKGKSMTTEEIDLNDAFAHAGIDAVETDLGEYIVQLRGERPSHIITPAHSSVEGRHRPAVHRQVRHRVHRGAGKAHGRGALAIARDFSGRGFRRHRRQLRDRGNRHAGRGRERRQRPPVEHDAGDVRRGDGNREGDPAARRPEPFSGNPRAHRDRAEAHDLHQLHHRAAARGRARRAGRDARRHSRQRAAARCSPIRFCARR